MDLVDILAPTIPRRPRPDRTSLVRGRYRLLTLPEVATLLPDHIPSVTKACEDLCWDGEDPNSEHHRLIRQVIGPTVQALDVWKIRQWLGRPVIMVQRDDIMRCSYRRHNRSSPDYRAYIRDHALCNLHAFIPQRICRGRGREDGLVVVGRQLRVTGATKEDWMSFLEPYSTENRDPAHYHGWHEFEWPVRTDGFIEGLRQYGYPGGKQHTLVFAELLEETRLP